MPDKVAIDDLDQYAGATRVELHGDDAGNIDDGSAEEPAFAATTSDDMFQQAFFWKAAVEAIDCVEQRVARADAHTQTETLLWLRNCVLVMQERVKSFRERIDQTFIDAIEAHGPIESGNSRFIVTVAQKTHCVNARIAMEGLLEAVEGDIARFCQQLVAQPFKPASARAVLASEIYERCFETVEKKAIGEQAVKKLTKLDSRFLKLRKK